MTFQYGNGFEKDLKSLAKWIKKEYDSNDFDPSSIEDEINKILKYNKIQIIVKEAIGEKEEKEVIGEKIVEEFDTLSSFAHWFNKWDESYTIEIHKEKFCGCNHSEKFHNQKEGCTYQYPLDSGADYKDNQGYCICTKFIETKSITCDVCGNEFHYQENEPQSVEEEKTFETFRPADELPDGYLIGGNWICDDCGSCSECGTSLEKEGNMTDHQENKLCRDCEEKQ